MHALIVCEESRQAELLTVALRQMGLRGVVRRTPPTDVNQLTETAIIVLDCHGITDAEGTLLALRDLTTAPKVVLCPPTDQEALLILYRAGATYVIAKPADLRIVAAQAAALTNLVAMAATPIAHPFLDPDRQCLILPNGSFRLTTLEYRLVAALLSRPGRAFTPDSLVEYVWGYNGEGDRSLVKGLVNRVRRKIEPTPQNPIYLVTEVGVGYRFIPPDGYEELES